MLVLSRKPGERLVLTDTETGQEVGVITIVRVSGLTVRLGIECPTRIGIARDELLAPRQQEQTETAA